MAARGADLLIKGDEKLGYLISDWKERGFELCHSTCEFRYHARSITNENREHESKHAPGTISLGFIQSHTTVDVGDVVETSDRNLETAEKLKLHTIVLAFQTDDSIYPKYCVVGHTDVNERDRWFHAIRFIVERKMELQAPRPAIEPCRPCGRPSSNSSPQPALEQTQEPPAPPPPTALAATESFLPTHAHTRVKTVPPVPLLLR